MQLPFALRILTADRHSPPHASRPRSVPPPQVYAALREYAADLPVVSYNLDYD